MKKLLLVTLIALSKLAFSQHTFEQIYSGQSWGNGCEFTNQMVWADTSYIAAFNRYNGTCDYNSEIIFFNPAGTETKRIYVPQQGRTNLEYLVKGKADNLFAIGEDYGCWDSDFVFIQNVDYLNGQLWYKKYGFPIGFPISVSKLIATPDSGCIIFYSSNSTSHIRKLNKLGNTIYHQVDSNFIMSGTIISTDLGFYAFSNQYDSLNNPIQVLTKYNMNLDSLSSIVLNNQNIFASKIILLNDSNFFMFGIFKDSTNHFKTCIAKLDTLWNLIWKTTLPDSTFQYTDLAATSDGNFLLSRLNLLNPVSISSDIIRYSSIGDSIFGKNYSTFSNTSIVSISPTNDGGYFAVGLGDTSLLQAAYMLKADSLGNITSLRNIYLANKTAIQVYPNPATDFITVKNKEQNSSFAIYNIWGNQVAKGTINSKTDISTLPKGLYFVKVDSQTPVKILKQ